MKIIFGVLLIAFIFLSLIAWLGYSSRNDPEGQASHDQQATETQKKEYPSLKASLKIGFIRLGEFIHDFREEIVAVGTLFIAVFTVILAFATGFLYFATKELVKGAEDTAERQLRAYVGIVLPPADKLHITNRYSVTVPAIVALGIQNSGSTPAYKLIQKSGITIRPYPLPDDTDFTVPSTAPPYPMTLMPGTSDTAGIQITAQRPFTANEIAAITDGRTRRLYIWGTINYEDAFGLPHYTNFCMGIGGNMENPSIERCKAHNDSD